MQANEPDAETQGYISVLCADFVSSRSTICVRLLAVALSIWVYVFFFLLPRVTAQSFYVTIRQKNCRPCFQKTSHITWDTEVPGPLNNTLNCNCVY